jgi:hypothetical protein
VGCFTSVWWLQKVGKPQGGAFPPRRGGGPPRRGGHLGHVFRGQARVQAPPESHLEPKTLPRW